MGALLAVGGSTAAGAAPIGAGTASAFAITADVFGTEVIPPTPTAETTAPAADETNETVIGIPGTPLIVNGTLIARTVVHTESDLATTLGQPASAQSVAGPYNARAVGQIESAQVLIDPQVPGGELINAELVTAEAVAVCKAGAVQYSASSEVVNLQIGGEDPFSGPLNDALTQITDGLAPFADAILVELNVKNVDANGASVDAVVVTVLGAAVEGGAPGPLVKVVLGHAEVSGVACAAALPQCSDTVDNADTEDALADAADPGCHSDGDATNAGSYVASDDDETNAQCSDGVDNADTEDTLADAADPGCHTDGDATNAASYNPGDNDEANVQAGALPKAALAATGGGAATGLAVALGAGALCLFSLRRRLA